MGLTGHRRQNKKFRFDDDGNIVPDKETAKLMSETRGFLEEAAGGGANSASSDSDLTADTDDFITADDETHSSTGEDQFVDASESVPRKKAKVCTLRNGIFPYPV